MQNARGQFLALLCFLAVVTLVLSNGFIGVPGRIFAQEEALDVFETIEPVGYVLDEILDNYYQTPDLDSVVEGALMGMMNSLDRHSAYIPKEAFEEMREDTEGQFEGIGVKIRANEQNLIEVVQPIAGSPALKAGMQAGDIIVSIDEVSTQGMGVVEAAQRIKGPKGTTVQLEVFRQYDDEERASERLVFDIKRGKIALDSILGARMLEGGVVHLWLGDFKKNTSKEIKERLEKFTEQGMTALILDLRWNPGGLLTSAGEVCDLFLPKNTLVTYTKGRKTGDKDPTEDIQLHTERSPILPENFPVVVLANGLTASSSEIVTGALQYYKRALVIGEQTYGKGSVQTIIPLRRPQGSALRLTTALYYTPGGITINNEGIKPDVEAPMDKKVQLAVMQRMYAEFEGIPLTSVTSEDGSEVEPEEVEDIQLQRAVEILLEEPVFSKLLAHYHKDTSETQVAAADNGEEAAQL